MFLAAHFSKNSSILSYKNLQYPVRNYLKIYFKMIAILIKYLFS